MYVGTGVVPSQLTSLGQLAAPTALQLLAHNSSGSDTGIWTTAIIRGWTLSGDTTATLMVSAPAAGSLQRTSTCRQHHDIQ